MPEITGFGLDISGFNASLKQAEESFNRLKRTGVATAQAINKAFADASNGGIQQMRQSLDNMLGALSKDSGAQKSVEKVGQAVTNVGTQAAKSATGIDALIKSISMGGNAYSDLMAKINGAGQSGTKNSELVKVEKSIEENKKKLAELKTYIDQFGKSEGLTDGARREAAEIKNTIDMLERKKESLLANIRLQERLSAQKNDGFVFNQNTAAKQSSDAYVKAYDSAIKDYEKAWEQVDKRLAKNKVAEYKATLTEMMSLDKSMYSSDKGGKTGTEDARVVEARYKELTQRKLALENELDQIIARNKENAENKLAQQVENIKKRSDARISAENQRRVVQESKQEADEFKRTQNEKVAAYRAILSDMKKLDRDMHYVETKGTPAEKANIAAIKAEYDRLNKEKERMETELGGRITRIRNSYERQTQSENAKRVVQDRIFRENEAKRAANEAKRIARETAAEERRIEQEKLREYRSIRSQMLSLDNDMHLLRKKGTTPEDAARLEELKRKEQELNRERARLSQELGDKKSKIDREYDNRYLAQIAKRHVRESELTESNTKRLKRQVRQGYEEALRESEALLKKMRNAEKLGGKTSTDPNVRNAYAEYERQLNAYDARRRALESQYQAWVADLQAKNTTKKLDEDINAIRRKQAEEQAAAAAKAKADSLARQQSYQSYVTSYDGAMRVSNKVFSRQLSENEHIKAIENLTAARKKLNESDANYKKQVEELNKAIQKHEEFLARASRTTDQNTEAARRNVEQQRRRQDQIDRSRKNPTEILATDTSNMTLRELRNFSASVKATMADLTPRSNEWNQLNGVLRNTTKQIDGIKREMGLLRGQTGATADAVANLGRFMSAAFIAQKIWSFTNAVVNLSGEFEQMHVAINVIVGSLEDANKIWEQTMELAVKSPFQAKELIKYTRQLAAYRIETSKLHDTTKMLADVSAGLGVDMSRLILAYGQVRAAEYLRGTELRQFTEAGVPMLEELSKHFTELEGRVISTAEVFDMISKRQVNFSDVNAVLESMTSDGGPFYKMQEQMSNTIKGTISNLKDEVDLMMYEIGQSSDGWIKGTLKTLRFLVKQWEIVGAAIKIVLGLYLGYQASALVTAFRSGAVASALAGEAVALTGVASGYVKAKLAMQAFNTAMMGTPIGWIIAGVTALLSIITLVTRKWSDNKKAQEQRAAEIEDEMNRISEAYEGMKKRVGQALEVFDDADSSARDAEVALYKLVELASDEYHLTFQVDVKGKSKEEIKQEATKIATEVLAVAEDTRSLQESWARSWETMSLSFDKYYTAVKQVGTKMQTINGEDLETAVYETYVKKDKKGIEDELTDAQKAITDYFESVRGKIKEELTREEEQAALSMSPMEVLRMYLNKKSTSGKELDANETMVLNAIDVINEAYDKIADEILASEYLSNDKGSSIQSFLGALIKDGEMTEVQVKELQAIIEKKLGHSLTVTSTSLTDWQKKFNEFLATVPDASLANLDSSYIAGMGDRYKKLVDGERSNDFARFFDAISPGDNVTQEALAKNVKEELDKWENIKKAYEGAMKKGVKSIYSKDDYELALKGIEFLDPVNTFLTGGEDKDKKQKAIKILNDRIELIKKMHKQYIDEYKTFGDDAEDAVAKAYKKAFKDAFEGTGIQFSGLVIDKGKLTELQKAGDEAGEAFSEAMLAKMAEVAEKGTYIRDITADAIDLLREHEDIRNQAYQDSGGVWTIGMGQTFNRKENRPVQEGDYWTDEEILMYSQEEIKSKRKDLNDILELHRDILLTQEQYNQVFNATWQGGKGSTSALFQYAKDAEAFKGWLEELDNMPIVQVLLDDEGKIKERKPIGAWDIDVDAEIKKFNELESVYERIALVMKYISVRDAANRDTTESMIARAQGRADAFRGDLAVVHLLQKAAVDVSQVDFTNMKGVVNILKQLKPIAEKEGEEAVQTLEEAIAGFEAQIGVDLKKGSDEKIKDKVQKIFGNYELSLELKELNIPPDLGKSLFGAEYLTLDALKENVINQFAEGAKDGGDALKTELNQSVDKINWKSIEDALGKDQAGEVKKRLEEIDKLENKAAKERMKTYSKYLVEGMNDRVKLKIEEMRKLKEIEESKEFSSEQKEQIKKQVSKEAREEQDKQEWEDFKGTEMYTMMFDDLELLGTKALDILQKKLEDLKGSLSDLPASEVKEIVQQISKIEDVTIAKSNPFKYMREEIKGKDGEIAKFEKETGTDFKKESEFQTDLLNAQAAEEEAQRIIDAINLVKNAQLEHGADKGLELVKATDEETYNLYMKQVEAAQKQNQTLEQVLKTQDGIVESSKKAAANASRGINIHQRSKKALQEQANTWSEYESQASEAFAVTKELMTTLGADTDGVAMSLVESGESLVMLTFQAIQFGIQMQIAGYQANMALGVIGWILIAVQAIATVLSAIFSAKDKALQKEIDGHLARAEKLHEKYEELSDAIDSAYDASVVRQFNKEIEKTIQLEIKAIEAAIAAEKSQKDSKIDWGWVDEQEKKVKELYNTLNEEHDNYIERWGGFGSDEARLDFIESMTQAWLDSFKETGDGLAGLEEKWDEYFDNLALKQMTLRVSKAAIDKYLDMWDKYVSAESAGGEDLTEAEAQDLRLEKEKLLKDLSEKYLNLAESLGVTPTTEGGGLSALQKGIQGITEDTAQVLESLLNSMRLYVADTNMHIKDQTDYIKKMWKIMDDSINGQSPFYVQMKNI